MKRDIFIVALVALAALTACKEEISTDPYKKDQVHVNAFGPSPLYRGDTIAVIGSKLNMINSVAFPALNDEKPVYEYVTEFIDKTDDQFYVIIPDSAIPGHLGFITSKDTLWSEATMTFNEDIEVTGYSPEDKVFYAGDDITIKGEFMWNVAQVIFPGGTKVDAIDFKKVTRHAIVVPIPDNAVDGQITLNDGADWSFKIEKPITVIIPTLDKLERQEYEYGDEIVVTGKHLELITKVNFPGQDNVEPKARTAESMTFVVPDITVPGVITFINELTGFKMTSDSIFTPLVTIASIGPKKEDLYPGEEVVITGKLLDRVKYLLLPNGEKLENIKYVQQPYEINEEGTEIRFKVVKDQGDGGIVLFQHENSQPKTDGLFMHRAAGAPFYEVPGGGLVCDSWDVNVSACYGNEFHIAAKKVITGPGALTVNVEQIDADYHCIQMQDIISSTWCNPQQIDLEPGQRTAIYNLTQEQVDQIQAEDNNSGLAFLGYGMIIKSFEWKGAGDPEVVWEGSYPISGWSNCEFGKGEGEPADLFATAGVQNGSLIRLYFTDIAEDWGIKFYDGMWSGFNASDFGYGDAGTGDAMVINATTAPDVVANGYLDLEIRSDDIATRFADMTYLTWGITFVFQGQGLTLTKIAVKN